MYVTYAVKSFASLKDSEIRQLKLVCKKNGAFREILKSHSRKKIPYPENIHIAICYHYDKIIGWALLDCAEEYNQGHQTVMAYVRFSYRKKGIATILVECLKQKIDINNRIVAFPDDEKREGAFFNKVAEKIGISIELDSPKCYFGK